MAVPEAGAVAEPVASGGPLVQIDFSNPGLDPARWTLRMTPDGSGWFDAKAGVAAKDSKQVSMGDLHRPVRVSGDFAGKAFAVARSHRMFAFSCESHMKVAFQGTKRLSYAGPEGTGSCEYNYSKDKEIEALGDSLVSVSATILYGARLEVLLQHDRLGLDQEMDNLVAAVHAGNALELGTIRETLLKIEGDDQVLERARKKARLLLTQAN